MMLRFSTLGLIMALGINLTAFASPEGDNDKKSKSGKTYTLPIENKLPLTLNSFCSGVPNVMAITTQNISQELSVLCNGQTPTATFQEIFSNPYTGDDDPRDFMVDVPPPADLEGELIQLYVAYAVKVPKKAVSTLISEEPIALIPYAEGILKITPTFMEPPENLGDADTSFLVQQVTDVNRQNNPEVIFNDVSVHRLNMYRLHPDNFDYFLAARTLTAETEQFKVSNIVRGVMSDPVNPDNSSYVFTVLNVIMNSRGDPNGNVGNGMRDTFFDFFETSISDAFAAQTR